MITLKRASECDTPMLAIPRSESGDETSAVISTHSLEQSVCVTDRATSAGGTVSVDSGGDLDLTAGSIKP